MKVAAVVFAAAALAGVLWYVNRPEYRFQKGLAALAAGNYAEVAREARRLSTAAGFAPESHLLTGAVLTHGQRYEAALRELYQVPESAPFAAKAMVLAAECNYCMGRFAESARVAFLAVELDPDNLDGRRWLVSAYYDVGATAQAAEQLAMLSKASPGDYKPERLLGLIEKDGEQFGKAVEHYQEALRRNPPDAARQEISLELAQSLLKLSRFSEAVEALAGAEETINLLTLLAECESSLGHAEVARETVDRALALDPEFAPALVVKARLLLLAGDAKAAGEVLVNALRLRPDDWQVHQLLSQVYMRQGDRARSDEELVLMKKSQALAREFTDLHERAMRDLTDADVRYRLGVLAARLHTAELARVWFRAALAIDPDHPQARKALEESTRGELGPAVGVAPPPGGS